jgi:hypothetical protein
MTADPHSFTIILQSQPAAADGRLPRLVAELTGRADSQRLTNTMPCGSNSGRGPARG